ncbi:MAG: phosphopyruvate hydratase [bacterium]|nr:phosphopyruvate hydratase [bacterium]
MKISQVRAIEILDSRGKPTVRAFITLEDGSVHNASVPSGASTGKYEALELRDGDEKRFQGQGVQSAVTHINNDLSKLLIGKEVGELRQIDQIMLDADGTENKSKMGANAILAVSLAVARAAACADKKPLWQFLHDYYFSKYEVGFPRLMVNVVNGGKHAQWNFDIQEFMIVPKSNIPSESTRIAAEVFAQLGKILKKRSLSILVGDEGGYSPSLASNNEVLDTIITAAQELGYSNGKEYEFALDAAASEFFENDGYIFKKENRTLSPEELVAYYLEMQKKYGVYSFEDPFSEDDWKHFAQLTAHSNGEYLVVGDDLFVTNPKRLTQGIEQHAANAILVKVNQIGTLLETVEAIIMAREAGFKIVISHRSGETEDSFIADLAYACGSDLIKTGSMSRSDRLSKYNRLLEIEAGL